jgi:hypothetical protein
MNRLSADEPIPGIRRVLVPFNRPDQWPNGDWQPIPLADFERQLDRVAAGRSRPRPYIERADYSATLVDGEWHDARVEWRTARPDTFQSLLTLGQMNLNISQLAWSASEPNATPSKAVSVAALWGTTPEGTTGIVLDRRQGRLVGEWSRTGRKLPASTEFDLELPPAAMSRLTLKVPAGLVLGSTAGDVWRTEKTSAPGWNEWRLDLGSRTSARLRVAPLPDSNTASPLIIVRNNLNYAVSTEVVRLLAEFVLEPLETVIRDVRLEVNPEIQVTSVEYGDGGAVAWQSSETVEGRVYSCRI